MDCFWGFNVPSVASKEYGVIEVDLTNPTYWSIGDKVFGDDAGDAIGYIYMQDIFLGTKGTSLLQSDLRITDVRLDPEPASLCMLIAGGLALIRRRSYSR